MSMKVGILDYGVGNIKSVYNAVKRVGSEPVLLSDPDALMQFSHIIAPGVGNFGYVVKKFEQQGFQQAVKEYIDSNRYYLGVCVGMQMLFQHSDESSGIGGLGIINGTVVKMSDESIPGTERKIKLPHIGWSKLQFKEQEKSVEKFFSGVSADAPFYFVHSYTAKPSDEQHLFATAKYGVNEVSALVCKDNVYGTQFHPERSGEQGLKLIENFCGLN